MATNSFVYCIYINASAEQLWEALTESEFIKQYWGGVTMESDWKAGSRLKMTVPQAGGRQMEGEILISDPPNLLSYTGIGGSKSSVTFDIRQVSPSEVKLLITHEGFDNNARSMLSEGWYAILSSLKTLLETGKALDHSWWRG